MITSFVKISSYGEAFTQVEYIVKRIVSCIWRQTSM